MGMTVGDGPPPIELMAGRIVELQAEVERLRAEVAQLRGQGKNPNHEFSHYLGE